MSAPVDFDVITDHRSASVIQIESNKLLPLILILCVLVGGCIAGVLIGYSILRDRVMDAETETRLLEYYVMQSDAEMVKQGFKKSEDTFQHKRGK